VRQCCQWRLLSVFSGSEETVGCRLALDFGATERQNPDNKGEVLIAMGKIYLRSEVDKDCPAADYPGDLCFFNWRFSRQIVELEMKRLKGKGK
jgi:hypothetical protein